MNPQQTPPGQQPVHAQPNTEGNTIAIVGLVLAVLFCPAGLVCSIIGLKKAKRLGGKGRGVALAGLIVSIAFVIIGLLAIPAIVSTNALALQRNARNNQRNNDRQAISGRLATVKNNNNGVHLTSAVFDSDVLGRIEQDIYKTDRTITNGISVRVSVPLPLLVAIKQTAKMQR